MKGRHAASVAARAREDARTAETDAARARREAVAATTRISDLEREVVRLRGLLADADATRIRSVEAAVAETRADTAAEIAHARRMLVRLFKIADEIQAPYIGDIDDLALEVLLMGPDPTWSRTARRNLRNPAGIAGIWRDYCRRNPEDESMVVVTKVSPLARRYELERLAAEKS